MFQESNLHLYIHPAIQLLGIYFGFTALYWGGMRFVAVHHKILLGFPWKQHVLYGKIAIFLWLAGIGVGVYFAKAEWSYYRITGDHFVVGMATIPFLLSSFISGYWMDTYKKRRNYLSIAHGVSGFLLCALVFIQIITGFQVLEIFIW